MLNWPSTTRAWGGLIPDLSVTIASHGWQACMDRRWGTTWQAPGAPLVHDEGRGSDIEIQRDLAAGTLPPAVRAILDELRFTPPYTTQDHVDVRAFVDPYSRGRTYREAIHNAYVQSEQQPEPPVQPPAEPPAEEPATGEPHMPINIGGQDITTAPPVDPNLPPVQRTWPNYHDVLAILTERGIPESLARRYKVEELVNQIRAAKWTQAQLEAEFDKRGHRKLPERYNYDAAAFEKALDEAELAIQAALAGGPVDAVKAAGQKLEDLVTPPEGWAAPPSINCRRARAAARHIKDSAIRVLDMGRPAASEMADAAGATGVLRDPNVHGLDDDPTNFAPLISS